MSDTVPVVLNGSQIAGRSGMTILELAQENGIDIPTLCYRPELKPIGACRLCMVEVEGSRTLVASCHTPITPNMVIQTHSPKVLGARRLIVELLLASHPDMCIVCDKANICEFRKVIADLDVGLPRFRLRKHYYPMDDENPYIVRDMSKCILCRRCVSACRELKNECVFAIAYRGFDSKVVVDLDQPLHRAVCESCDVCIEMCPTGALSKPERGERHAAERRRTPLVVTGR